MTGFSQRWRAAVGVIGVLSLGLATFYFVFEEADVPSDERSVVVIRMRRPQKDESSDDVRSALPLTALNDVHQKAEDKGLSLIPPQETKPTITIYIEPARTRNTLFLSHRLVAYSRGKYEYRHVILNSKLSRNVTTFRHEVCVNTPGYKVFIGHGELVLRNWPGNCLWSVTGDEAGDWGLKRNGKYFGLHGPGNLLPTDEAHPLGRIIVPEYAKPWFRQYYDTRQTEAFGNDTRFLPLGSRLEFPNLKGKSLPRAAERQFLYSYMVGLTDLSRKRLHEVLVDDTLIPKDRVSLLENTYLIETLAYASMSQVQSTSARIGSAKKR
jgi:hypothetical protein